MTCPLLKEDLIFNLTQGLGYEERSLALYEEFLVMLEGKELSAEEIHDKEIIERIASDERRHITIAKRLITIAEEYYHTT